MTRIALLAAVLPAIAFAQQPPANDNVEKPAAVTTPTPEQQPQTPPPTTEEKKDEHASCPHGEAQAHGKGWSWGGKWHGRHGQDGVAGKWQGWHDAKPWRFALEGGAAFGLGLTAQLSYRPRPSFAVGVGAIGFGSNAIERGFDDSGRGPSLDADVRQGYFVSVQRYRGWGRGGFFAGAKVGAANVRLVSREGEVDRLWTAFVTPELGLQWFPFQRAMFIRPAVGASLVVARWGGTENAPVPPFIVPSATLTLGFAL